MSETKIPVTPQEDEAWDALADVVAAKVVAALDSPRDDRPPYSVKEFGDRLGISESSARHLVNSYRGKPPRVKSIVIGDGARKIEAAEVDRYLAELREAR